MTRFVVVGARAGRAARARWPPRDRAATRPAPPGRRPPPARRRPGPPRRGARSCDRARSSAPDRRPSRPAGRSGATRSSSWRSARASRSMLACTSGFMRILGQRARRAPRRRAPDRRARSRSPRRSACRARSSLGIDGVARLDLVHADQARPVAADLVDRLEQHARRRPRARGWAGSAPAPRSSPRARARSAGSSRRCRRRRPAARGAARAARPGARAAATVSAGSSATRFSWRCRLSASSRYSPRVR